MAAGVDKVSVYFPIRLCTAMLALSTLLGCVGPDGSLCRSPATPEEIATAQKVVSDGRFKEHSDEWPPFTDYFLDRDVTGSSVCGSIITVLYELNLERADRPTFNERSPPSRLVVNTIDRTYKLQGLSEFRNGW